MLLRSDVSATPRQREAVFAAIADDVFDIFSDGYTLLIFRFHADTITATFHRLPAYLHRCRRRCFAAATPRQRAMR
jgi:hypothetical protein